MLKSTTGDWAGRGSHSAPRALIGSVTLAVLLCGGLLFTSCSQQPGDLHQAALKAATAAKDAYEKQDAKAAEKAALRAEKAANSLASMAQAGKLPQAQAEKWLNESAQAAQTARRFAQWAREEKEIRERLATWRVKAYRKARGTICEFGFSSFLPILEQARSNYNSLSPLQQEIAQQAWNLSAILGGRKPLPDGAPDWAGVAQDFKAWRQNPPPPTGMFLALVFQVSGLPSLALSEIESVEPRRFSSNSQRSLWHAERALIYDSQGYKRLALREAEFALSATNELSSVLGKQYLAMLHFFLCLHAIDSKDFARADAELVETLRIWPDNPIAVFLTGEKLNADGQWVQAADSLEQRIAGTKNEKIARRLAQRAREIRDGKGGAKALFDDKAILLELLWEAAAASAAESEAMKKFHALLESARTFGRRVAEKLPGTAEAEGQKKER